MAVDAQAQQSSIFQINRGVPDCCEQGEAGLVDHHSHMETINRKRQRENESAFSINHSGSFPFQSQSQLINLSGIHPQRDGNLNPGLCLYSDHSLDSIALDAYATRQREELECFLKEKGEEMLRGLAEKRQRYVRALMNMAEESLSRKLRAKDMEIEKAMRRNAELEKRAAQLGVEAQLWQARARASEVAAATLRMQLEQAIMVTGEGAADDAESVCEDPNRVMGDQSCRVCRRRAARRMVLPCCHLSLCEACNLKVLACPVCLRARESSVEVLFC